MGIRARVVDRSKIDPDQFVTLDHVRVSGQDYTFRKLRKYTAVGSRLEQCRFDNASIGDASFGSGREMSEYVECSFDRIHIDHMGGHARFVQCSFLDARIKEWLGQSTELIDCTFGGQIGTAMFCGRIPNEGTRRDLRRERNEFHGNDFSKAKLTDVNFSDGIDLTQQQLPQGPEYLYVADATSAAARLRAGLETWNSNPEVRRSASIIADIFTKIMKGGQQQLFLRPRAYYELSEKTFPREALDKVFALLRGETQY